MNDFSLPRKEQVRLCSKERPEALFNLVTWIYEAYLLVPHAFLIIFQIYHSAFINITHAIHMSLPSQS